jgi:hypothetical protein
VFEQSATAMTVSSLQVPPKQATIYCTSNLFKKQRLWLKPTFLEPEISNIAYLHGIKDEPITVDKSKSKTAIFFTIAVLQSPSLTILQKQN